MKKNDDERDAQSVPDADGGARKPYAAPTLTEHGAVEAVTTAGGDNPGDLPLGT